jgi:hypothetical protein
MTNDEGGTMLTRLTREAILGARDRETVEVAVPEWGGTVLVRGLSAGQKDDFELSVIGPLGGERNLANLRARLCARCMVDADGQPLFGEVDVAALGERSAAAIERVFNAARRLSGMSDADVAELAKN